MIYFSNTVNFSWCHHHHRPVTCWLNHGYLQVYYCCDVIGFLQLPLGEEGFEALSTIRRRGRRVGFGTELSVAEHEHLPPSLFFSLLLSHVMSCQTFLLS